MNAVRTAVAILFATATSLAHSSVIETCSWDKPGVNPYVGSIAKAINHYTDIPVNDRMSLISRMKSNQFDEVVTITRDKITGKVVYEPSIRSMHFGTTKICSKVTRSKWADSKEEKASVYCANDNCILLPHVCGNVSRIDKMKGANKEPEYVEIPTGSGGGGGVPTFVFEDPIKQPVANDLPAASGGGLYTYNGGYIPFGYGGPIFTGSGPGKPVHPTHPEHPEHPEHPTNPPVVTPPVEPPIVVPPVVVPPVVIPPVVVPPFEPPVVIDPPVILPPVTTPVPEPSTIAMFLLGLGLLGFMSRKK
jgi:hypothetical protein